MIRRSFVRSHAALTALVRSHAALAALAALAASLGCAPPPPPTTTPVAVVATSPAAAAALPLDEDLSPVPEPEQLTAVLRIGSPVADLVMLKDILPAHTDFGQLAALGPQGVAHVVFGSLGSFVDVAAPLDIAVLEGDSTLVGSVVLRDFEEARRAAGGDFSLRPAPDGHLIVTPRPGAKNAGLLPKGLECGVFRGGAPPAFHLVCSGDATNLEIAGPYLARTVAQQPARVGLTMDFPEKVFRDAIAAEGSKLDASGKDETAAEAAGRELGEELIRQFSDDFKDTSIGLTLGPSGVVAGLDLRFSSVQSLLSLGLVGSRGSGVPATFWKLPADADTAFYFPGAPPESMRPVGAKLWKELEQRVLADESEREGTKAFCAVMTKLLFTGGPWMAAHGPAPKGAVPPEKGAPFVKRFQKERQNVAGWALYGVAEPASTWTAGARELLRLDAFSQPQSKKGAGTSGSSSAAGSKKDARKPSRTRSSAKEVAIKASEGLPAGAVHVAIHEDPNPDYKGTADKPPLQAPVDTHLFIAGTATDTWLVVSENEALARTKLIEAVKGDAGGIGGRPELAPLRSMPGGGVGFTSMQAIATLLGGNETEPEIAEAAEVLRAIADLPSSGATPLFLSMSPGPSGEKGGATLRVTGLLSLQGTIDLVQWLHR